MVFRGRGGRPPRGRGIRGRGRGRGSGYIPPRGGLGRGSLLVGGREKRERSRSRSRSPRSKRHTHRDEPSSSSRDKSRRERSRERSSDRDRSRDRDRRHERKAHSSSSEKGRSKHDRSASPYRHDRRSSSNMGKRSGSHGSDRDSHDKKRRPRSRSHSPPSDRSIGRSPGYSGSPPRNEEFYDERPSTAAASGFYGDNLDEISRSKWDSPERGESPDQNRRGRVSPRESPRRGQSEDFQSPSGPKFRSSKGVSSAHLQTESLRITVGNERFQGKTAEPEREDTHKSAMDRLGPPVSQELQESEDLDDLYQDLPPPAPIPSMPHERKSLPDFSIGNTTPLRDEAAQKERKPLKPKSKSGDGRQHGSSLDKDKSRERGKDKDNRSKRSKERDYNNDDKPKIRPKDHEKNREDTGQYPKERNHKGNSRERSYERDRGDLPRRRPDFSPSERHGKPAGAPQTPPVDAALTQATLLVQSIRQSTSIRGDQRPGAAGSQPVGGSGGHPPHTGAPYAQQMPGGADGMYHQGSRSGYPSAPGGQFPSHLPHLPPPHQYQQQAGQPPIQQQQYPHTSQQLQHTNLPPQQYTQGDLNQQHRFAPVQDAYKNQQGTPSTEYNNPFPSYHHGGHTLPGMEPQMQKKLPDVHFGSVDEEDLFLYGDTGDNSQHVKHDTEKKREQTPSTSDFWSKRAGPMEEYVPEVKPAVAVAVPAPVEEKQPEKTSGEIEDDQIKKILSVIGFDFDLAKKIADQKKQQEEEEKLRRQARASKKSSVRPSSTDPSDSPQTITSLAGQRENPPRASFNPSSSFLDSGLRQATESGGNAASFIHDAKQSATQSQQGYEQQHERMPTPQQVASQQSAPTSQALLPTPHQQGVPASHEQGLPPQQGVPSSHEQGVPPQQGAPPSHQPGPFALLPTPTTMYDQYGRPLPPPPELYPPHSQPFQQYQTAPPPPPFFPHPGAPPPHQQGYVPPPIQPPQLPYYPDQHGTQYPPPNAPQQGYDQSYPPNSEASGGYQPSHSYQQHSPERYSRSRSRGRSRSSSSRSSSSGRSGSSQSSRSESPERTPPPKRSRDRSRSHSQSVKDHHEDRRFKEKSKDKGLRRDEEYGPELPSEKEGSQSPRRIVLLPKSEREESSRKRKFKEVKEPDDSNFDKLKHLEKAELKKLRQLYKDEREALEKKKKKEEEKERILEEKKLQQALKRKEAERKKERELDEKKREAIEKRRKAEEERKRKEDEKERKEEERLKKEDEKQRKLLEAQERARQIKLAQDKHIYSKRLEALEAALARLRKQEGELLRKKQREKAGHRDPILAENNKLQDEIASQLKALRVAFSEGRVQHIKFEETIFKEEIKLRDKALETQLREVDARKAKEQNDRKSSKSSRAKTDEERAERQPFQFTYTDPGNHWCKLCKLSLQSLNNLFIHLHSKKHMQKCDPYCRPWVPDDISSKKPKGSTVTAPLGGAEFMMPVNAFYCKLCREFSGDGFCASEHLKSVKHNIKYQKFVEENAGYVKKLEIERAAEEKPAEVKDEKDKDVTTSKEKDKEEDKAKIRVDIGQRGGFGKFRFLKKEGDSSKESKEETKEIKKEERNEAESAIELRKSESGKQQSQHDKEKEKDGVAGKDGKKEIKINIKLSGRQFVPMSVQKTATPSTQPAKVTVKAKPPPPPPPVKSSSKAKTASKIDFKPKDSLDSFLSIGGKGKSLPVFKEVEKKQAVPSEDEIAAAFGGTKGKEEPKKETSESDETSGEDTQKPSFSDTLRKMLFTNSQKGNDKPGDEGAEEKDDLLSPEKIAESSFSSIFNTMLAGMQPGIPGIDDDELKPPGT